MSNNGSGAEIEVAVSQTRIGVSREIPLEVSVAVEKIEITAGVDPDD